jgi:hypothetical protein
MGHGQTAANVPREMVMATLCEAECIQRLADLLEHKDGRKLDEIVALIARLTAPLPFASN